MMAWRGIFPAVTTQMHAGGHIDDRGTAATVSRPVSGWGMVGENSVARLMCAGPD